MGIAQAALDSGHFARGCDIIIGGVFFGLSRRAATEFSFFLGGAGVSVASRVRALQTSRAVRLMTSGCSPSASSSPCLGIPMCRWLLRYISQHDFTVFAWYRIVFGGWC